MLPFLFFLNMPEVEEDNSKGLCRLPENETCLISVSAQSLIDNECISIAPGEGRQLKSTLNDKFCEAISFPHLFPQESMVTKLTEKKL